MIKINCKVKAKHNYKRINDIVEKLPQAVSNGIDDALNNLRGYAIRLEKGHNQEGILCEMVDTSTKEVNGRVYTDSDKFPWAMFEHYGTGDYRELEAIGRTKHFIETGGSQWFIPVAKVDKALHYPIIEINGMQFYVAHRSKSKSFYD